MFAFPAVCTALDAAVMRQLRAVLKPAGACCADFIEAWVSAPPWTEPRVEQGRVPGHVTWGCTPGREGGGSERTVLGPSHKFEV